MSSRLDWVDEPLAVQPISHEPITVIIHICTLMLSLKIDIETYDTQALETQTLLP